MNKIKEWLADWVYFHGFKVGIILITSPIIWDVLWTGTRCALFWAIGVKGMAAQIIGLVLMISGGRDSK